MEEGNGKPSKTMPLMVKGAAVLFVLCLAVLIFSVSQLTDTVQNGYSRGFDADNNENQMRNNIQELISQEMDVIRQQVQSQRELATHFQSMKHREKQEITELQRTLESLSASLANLEAQLGGLENDSQFSKQEALRLSQVADGIQKQGADTIDSIKLLQDRMNRELPALSNKLALLESAEAGGAVGGAGEGAGVAAALEALAGELREQGRALAALEARAQTLGHKARDAAEAGAVLAALEAAGVPATPEALVAQHEAEAREWVARAVAAAAEGQRCASPEEVAAEVVAAARGYAAAAGAGGGGGAAAGAADARPDFASRLAGARVVKRGGLTSATWAPPGPLGGALGAAAQALLGWETGAGPPEEALSPNVALGRCWAMRGAQGRLTVALARPLARVEAVTLEHAGAAESPDRGSAPRRCRVWALDGEDDPRPRPLGDLEYSVAPGAPALQTFPLAAAATDTPVALVMLEVLSNHGHPDFTCLYRLRVHGEEVLVGEGEG